MASVRNFKKDINFVTSELVIECFTYNYLFPEKKHDDLAKIISDSLALRSDLFKLVNAVKTSKNNTAKNQFKAIRNSFIERVEDIVKRLEKLDKE